MEIIASLGFWITSILLITSAIMTIFARKLSNCILFAFITFFLSALLFFGLSAPFNAVVQIMIYTVSICIMFVFAIMLTNNPKDEKKHIIVSKRLMLTVIGIILILISLIGIINQDISLGLTEFLSLNSNIMTDSLNSTQILGQTLFKNHIIAFEILSLLLTAGVCGIFILITKPEKEEK